MIDFDIRRDKNLKIHFIGIGGISMSGLADMLLHYGYHVSGSDARSSKIIDKLLEKGADINIGHDEKNVPGANLVIYTAAVKWDNPELIKAKELGIPIMDRAEFLGQIMKQYKYGIAVTGTHGKTTTTSLISLIMKNADLDPTIMNGGEVDVLGGNVRLGSSPYFVAEACEYVESFLKLHPYIGIILNIDADHLDYYTDLNHIVNSFSKFVDLIPEDGYLFACSDDENTMKAIRSSKSKVVTFGLKDDADWTARNIIYDAKGCGAFDAYCKGKLFGGFKLCIPGEHNVKNALCAIACTQLFDVKKDVVYESLLEFGGTRRRFEYKGEFKGITVIDDYAHHPTEIKATLSAALNYPHKRLWCIFQPHTYSRTIKLLDEFSTAFNNSDKLIMADIYAAREKDTGEINSAILSERIRSNGVDARYIPSFQEIADYVRNNASPGDVVITMGAGDIYLVGEMLLTQAG